MDKRDLMKRESESIFQTYGRQDVLLVRGRGARVWDSDGKEYLDFVAGIAVNSIGHCHPKLVEAVSRQAAALIHTSNLYYTENQVLLAEELNGLTGMERAYFCNSGAESIEAALKLVRRGTGKERIVAAERAFHGRTLGALALTYKSAYREPFRPLREAQFVPYNNGEALKEAVTAKTGAVILEPVQGEAGVYVPEEDYLRTARDVCDDRGPFSFWMRCRLDLAGLAGGLPRSTPEYSRISSVWPRHWPEACPWERCSPAAISPGPSRREITAPPSPEVL